MAKLKYNLNTATPPGSAKVHVSLAEGLGEKKEWNFTDNFSIGNHKDDDVRIHDTNVSRSHAVVYYSEGKWWVLDMHSSSGIIVDGRKISRKQLGSQTQLRLGWNGPILNLHTEDNVNMTNLEGKVNDSKCVSGQANLKQNEKHEYTNINEIKNNVKTYVDSSIYKYLQAPLKKWRKYSAIISSVILAGMILVGYGHLQENRRLSMDQGNTNVARTQADNENRYRVRSKRTDIETEIDGANSLGVPYNASKVDAVENVNKAVTSEQNNVIKSDVAPDHTSDIYFSAAKRFSEHRHWQAALEYYNNVSNINPDYPALHDKIAKMQFEIENQFVYAQGAAYIEKGQYEEGIACLKNITENSAYYIEVGQKIADAEKKMAETIEKQKQEDAAKALAAANKKALNDINGALSYYAGGKIEASLQNLERVLQASSRMNPDLKKRAKALKEKIKISLYLYHKGNEEYKSARHDMALNTWMRLLKVDKDLLGKKGGYFSRSVGQKMAGEYSSKAMQAFFDNDLSTAYKYSEMALNLHGNHSEALEVKKMLMEKS